jgi:electron transfer flavoprotein beta subunit
MSSSPHTDERPLVVACLRITDLRARVDTLSGAVERDPWGIGWPAPDAAALEYALRAAEAWSGRVMAVAAGSAAADPLLAEARALGAEVLRIPLDDEDDKGYAAELATDEHRLARLIAAALATIGRPVLVLCGDRSADRGTGALPAFLAHELGAAQALGLVHLELGHGGPDAAVPDRTLPDRAVPDRAEADPAVPDRAVLAERRLDGGWRERLRVPLPAVCSVEPAGVTLRRASLDGALASVGRPVPVAAVAPRPRAPGERLLQVGPTRPFRPRTRILSAPAGADPRRRVLALTGALVAHDPPAVIGPVGATEAADALVDFLVRHGYLDTPPAPGRCPGGTP